MGPALGQHGVNIMDFVKAYNEATSSQAGTIVPVEISIYEDRSFTFITKTPPAAVLLRQSGASRKGFTGAAPGEGGDCHQETGAADRRDEDARPHANDIDAAMKIVEGTARSMGIDVEG